MKMELEIQEVVVEDKSLWAIGQLEAHAVQFFKSGNAEMALRCLKAALSIVMPASDECRLRLRLGLLLLNHPSNSKHPNLSQIEQLAIENLQKASRLVPKQNVELKYKCALVLGRALEQCGRAQMALNVYEEQLREFAKMPLAWFETFVISKARLLSLHNMHSQVQKLLSDAAQFKPKSSFIIVFQSFLGFKTPDETFNGALECITRVLEELRDEDYEAVQTPLKTLMSHAGEIKASEHLVAVKEADFRNIMRLITIVYASIDGKQKLKDLIDGLEKLSSEKYLFLKRNLQSLFRSYQQKDVAPVKSQIPPAIQNALNSYFGGSAHHEIKAHLLEALKQVNLKTQNADRKALVLLLLAWLYCESDFELTLTMCQAAGMIGEWRESGLILMLAHGVLHRIFNLKGMPEEASQNYARAIAYHSLFNKQN